MKAAVLAVQGAFAEHIRVLHKIGLETVELREKKDLDQDFAGLVLPGGESTAQGKLLRELGMFDLLKQKIISGTPVLATCAGLILLAEHIVNDNRSHFATMPISVRRNAYGRQLGSFSTTGAFRGLGEIPMIFIRAPYIEAVSDNTEILAQIDGKIVAAKHGNQLATAFHPELGSDDRIHRIFADMMYSFTQIGR